MTNIFVVGALRESHLGALHKGATYQGSGMPDTRRDLFSLSTTRSVPLALQLSGKILTRSAPRAGDCEYSDYDSTSRYRRSCQFTLFVTFRHSGHSIYLTLFFVMYQNCTLCLSYVEKKEKNMKQM